MKNTGLSLENSVNFHLGCFDLIAMEIVSNGLVMMGSREEISLSSKGKIEEINSFPFV